MMVRGSVLRIRVPLMGYWGMDPLKEAVQQIRPALQVQRTQMAVEVKEYFGIILVIFMGEIVFTSLSPYSLIYIR